LKRGARPGSAGRDDRSRNGAAEESLVLRNEFLNLGVDRELRRRVGNWNIGLAGMCFVRPIKRFDGTGEGRRRLN
jgi:hypothetical protein